MGNGHKAQPGKPGVERTPGTGPSRKASWWRRWLLRPAVWFGAVLAVLAFALYLFLQSPPFARWAGDFGADWLSRYLGREVRLDGVEIVLVPLAVEVEGLVIAGPAADAPPALTLERGYVEADAGALRRRRLELHYLRLERPRLAVHLDEEGDHDLPIPRREPGGSGRGKFKLEIGTVEVVGGELALDDLRMPLSFSAANLEAALTGVDEGIELRGRVESDELALSLAPERPYPAAFEIDGLLRSHRFDLVQGRVTGPDLDASLSGFVRWRGDREVSLDIEAEGDLAVAGRLGYLEGLAAGPFTFDGSLTQKPGIYLLEGDVRSPAADLFERRLTGLEARVEGDRNAIRVDIEKGRYGGGPVSGTVLMGQAVDNRMVDLDLEVDQIPLARLLADQNVPIEGLGGGLSGVVNYRFSLDDPAAGDGWADLVVADEHSQRAGDLPLAGTAPITITGGVLRSDALRLASTGLEITANGSFDLGTSNGAYDFDLSTDRLGRVAALLPGAIEEGTPAIWCPTEGRGRVSGTLALAVDGASVRADLDLRDAKAAGYSADEVKGVVTVNGAGVESFRVELLRPSSALIVSGSLPFETAEAPTPETPETPEFSVGVDAVAWPLEDAKAWLPLEIPADGPFTGSVELGGALEAPAGRVEGRLEPLLVGDLQADGLDLSLGFDPDELRLDRGAVQVAGGEITVSGTLTTADSGLDFDLGSTPLRLSKIAEIGELSELGETAASDGTPDVPMQRLDGTFLLTGSAGGTLEEPNLSARLEWAGDEGSETAVDLGWSGSELSAHGSVFGIFDVDGGGPLSLEAADLAFVLSAGDVARLVELLGPETLPLDPSLADGLGGAFAGRLSVVGVLAETTENARPNITGSLEMTELTLTSSAGLDLRNLEPVLLVLDDEELKLRSIYLGDESEANEIFVGGSVSLEGALDLRLQLSVGEEWIGAALAQAWPEARLRGGAFDAIATIDGDLERLRVNGVGGFHDMSLVAPELPSAVEGLNGTLLFYRDQIVLDEASARTAGGSIQAGGSVTLPEDLADLGYRFQLAGDSLTFRSLEGWTARLGTELTVASTAEGRLLTGTLDLDQSLFLEDVELGLGQLFSALFEKRRVEVATADELLTTTQLNLRIQGERALRVRNNLADLHGSADLVLRGTAARPVVFGQVELEPGGRLEYLGNNYEIERGVLTFANPYRIEPVLDLVANTELREYDITLSVAGTPDRLTIDLVSNPPLADLEVLALLTGAPLSGAGAAPGSGDGPAAESFLYGQATSLVAQRFNRLFGLDKFRIDPLTSSSGSLSSARVTVGKQVSRDLAATYSYDLSETEDPILELEWSVSRTLVLVLTQNGDGTYALDARWEKAL